MNVILPCLSYGEDYLKKNTKELARSINLTLWTLIDKSNEMSTTTTNLAINNLIESLTRLMITPSDQMSVVTTIESLKWVLHLVNKKPNMVGLIKNI